MARVNAGKSANKQVGKFIKAAAKTVTAKTPAAKATAAKKADRAVDNVDRAGGSARSTTSALKQVRKRVIQSKKATGDRKPLPPYLKTPKAVKKTARAMNSNRDK
jgi:hypothetical protein